MIQLLILKNASGTQQLSWAENITVAETIYSQTNNQNDEINSSAASFTRSVFFTNAV